MSDQTGLSTTDRALLRSVFSWARANGWHGQRFLSGRRWDHLMGDDEVVWSYDADDRDAWTLVTNVVPAEAVVTSVAQAVDVLCALGVLPARFFSAIRNGYCHDEYGIFEDRREHGLGIAYTETRYTVEHALACAEEQRKTRPYPIEVKRRKVLHTDWEALDV